MATSDPPSTGNTPTKPSTRNPSLTVFPLAMYLSKLPGTGSKSRRRQSTSSNSTISAPPEAHDNFHTPRELPPTVSGPSLRYENINTISQVLDEHIWSMAVRGNALSEATMVGLRAALRQQQSSEASERERGLQFERCLKAWILPVLRKDAPLVKIAKRALDGEEVGAFTWGPSRVAASGTALGPSKAKPRASKRKPVEVDDEGMEEDEEEASLPELNGEASASEPNAVAHGEASSSSSSFPSPSPLVRKGRGKAKATDLAFILGPNQPETVNSQPEANGKGKGNGKAEVVEEPTEPVSKKRKSARIEEKTSAPTNSKEKQNGPPRNLMYVFAAGLQGPTSPTGEPSTSRKQVQAPTTVPPPSSSVIPLPPDSREKKTSSNAKTPPSPDVPLLPEDQVSRPYDGLPVPKHITYAPGVTIRTTPAEEKARIALAGFTPEQHKSLAKSTPGLSVVSARGSVRTHDWTFEYPKGGTYTWNEPKPLAERKVQLPAWGIETGLGMPTEKGLVDWKKMFEVVEEIEEEDSEDEEDEDEVLMLVLGRSGTRSGRGYLAA